MRARRFVIAITLGVFAGGCRSSTTRPLPSVSGIPPAAPKRGREASGPTALAASAITRDAAGPLRLGMSAAALRKLRGLTVTRVPPREKTAPPSVIVSRLGITLAVAELSGDRVSRIRVGTPDYRTAAGAHVGSSVQELEKLYGSGELLVKTGGVCARFEQEPGLQFCFPGVAEKSATAGDWAKLAAKNPAVRIIEIGGGK